MCWLQSWHWPVSQVSWIRHCSLNRTSKGQGTPLNDEEWNGILQQYDFGLNHYRSFGPVATSNLQVIAIFYGFSRSDRLISTFLSWDKTRLSTFLIRSVSHLSPQNDSLAFILNGQFQLIDWPLMLSIWCPYIG